MVGVHVISLGGVKLLLLIIFVKVSISWYFNETIIPLALVVVGYEMIIAHYSQFAPRWLSNI